MEKMAEVLLDKVVLAARMLDKVNLIVVFANYLSSQNFCFAFLVIIGLVLSFLVFNNIL